MSEPQPEPELSAKAQLKKLAKEEKEKKKAERQAAEAERKLAKQAAADLVRRFLSPVLRLLHRLDQAAESYGKLPLNQSQEPPGAILIVCSYSRHSFS